MVEQLLKLFFPSLEAFGGGAGKGAVCSPDGVGLNIRDVRDSKYYLYQFHDLLFGEMKVHESN